MVIIMKRKQKARECCATNCTNTDQAESDIAFFDFPVDRERSKKWVLNIGREDLKGRSTNSLHSFQFVCSKHFEDDQFTDDKKTTLSENAIPTIFQSSASSDLDGSTAGGSSLAPKADDCDGSQDMEGAIKDTDTVKNGEKDSRVLAQSDKTTKRKNGKSKTTLYKSSSCRNTHCQWCSAINCSNNRISQPELSFFRFPLNPERCKKWIVNSQRFDLKEKSNETLNNGSYIFCAEHFEKHCIVFNGKVHRLQNWAVPTIFNFDLTNKRRGRKPEPAFPSSRVSVAKGRRSKRGATAVRESNNYIDDDDDDDDEDSDDDDGSGKKERSKRLRRRALKRKHETVKSEEDTTEPKRVETVKELREENSHLSERLHQLLSSRVQVLGMLGDLEHKMDTWRAQASLHLSELTTSRVQVLKTQGDLEPMMMEVVLPEQARIDVGPLRRTLDISKHPRANQEFARLTSLINYLANYQDEVADKSEGEDTVSYASQEQDGD